MPKKKKKDREIDQWDRKESRTDPHIHSHLVYHGDSSPIQWKDEGPFNNDDGLLDIHIEKMSADPPTTIFTGINL